MKNFNDLSDQEKVEAVQYEFIEIINEIKANNSSLGKYIPEIKEPVFTRPHLVDNSDNEKLNQAVLKEAQNKFEAEKIKWEEYNKTKSTILNKINAIKECEDCICEPKEIDVDTNCVDDDFEIFIDFARKQAESKQHS